MDTAGPRIRVTGFIDLDSFDEDMSRRLFSDTHPSGLTPEGQEWLAETPIGDLMEVKAQAVTEVRV